MKRLVLDKNNQAEIIKQAISILKKGGVIVYPTETAYALGADFLNKKATNKIYKIKGRGSSKELPIIVSSLSMAKEYVKVDDIIKQFKNNRIKPDLIIDAGSLKKSKVSTIVSVDNKLKILRRGAIKL